MKEEVVELSSDQLERVDEIYNATHELLKVFVESEDLEWDMQLIGPVADYIASWLVKQGKQVRFPAVVETDEGLKTLDFWEGE